MIRTIHLYGEYSSSVGLDEFELDTDNVHDTLLALVRMFPKFDEVRRTGIDECKILTTKNSSDEPIELTKDGIYKKDAKHIHIIPTIGGEVPAAALAVVGITGIAANVVAFAINFVISMAINAIMSSVFSSKPQMSNDSTSNTVGQEPSFIWNGPFNVNEQGYAIPVVYGICQTGSILITADADSVNI